jgi:3'-phosphoadenosine 5'-phosphosulfate sulfotransferase
MTDYYYQSYLRCISTLNSLRTLLFVHRSHPEILMVSSEKLKEDYEAIHSLYWKLYYLAREDKYGKADEETIIITESFEKFYSEESRNTRYREWLDENREEIMLAIKLHYHWAKTKSYAITPHKSFVESVVVGRTVLDNCYLYNSSARRSIEELLEHRVTVGLLKFHKTPPKFKPGQVVVYRLEFIDEQPTPGIVIDTVEDGCYSSYSKGSKYVRVLFQRSEEPCLVMEKDLKLYKRKVKQHDVRKPQSWRPYHD